MYRIAIDTGGTFTDSLSIDEEGNQEMAKVPTTPAEPSRGILHNLEMLSQQRYGMSLKQLLDKTSVIMVGTTIATNTLAQLKGCKVGMITTKGFRDILEMRRIVRRNQYDLRQPLPVTLIPRYLRYPVEERMDYKGRVVTQLNEMQVREAAHELINRHKVEVICVFYLHSYINPAHEELTAEIIRADFPSAQLVLSSDILPKISEFERCNTTALGAYVSKEVSNFLGGSARDLKKAGYKRSLLLMGSNGGMQTVETCLRRPITLVGSGPAAGPVAARYLGELAGANNIISMDLGGTSLDISLLPSREVLMCTDGQVVEDQRNALPMVDVQSTGLGGGSIAWLDFGKILQIGPESAGADPGPACYGLGGKMPTVTDADVVLGYIPDDYFLGGQIKLNVGLAKDAIEKVVARPTGTKLYEAADAIVALAASKIADKIRLMCTERGYDPRGWTLCVGGGAGGTRALTVGRELGMTSIIIPKAAPVFCALGMLNTDIRHDFVRTYYQGEEPIDADKASQMYEEMERTGLELLRLEGVAEEQQEIVRLADIQYYGQINQVEAVMPRGTGANLDFEGLLADFHKRHHEIYGYSDPDFPTQVMHLRVAAIGKLPIKPRLKEQPISGRDPSGAFKRERDVYFKEMGGFIKTRVYDGDRLMPGNIVEGPAVIEERATTIVVPQGAQAKVDKYGNYLGKS